MRKRTEQEKLRDRELGQEGEKWVQRIFTASGYMISHQNEWMYHEGRLINFADLTERQKICPDFRISSTANKEYVEVKYRSRGKLWYPDLSRQLKIYPETHYVILCDHARVMFKAVPDLAIQRQQSTLYGVPIEEIWQEISPEKRMRLEEEIHDTKPFEAIKKKYA